MFKKTIATKVVALAGLATLSGFSMLAQAESSASLRCETPVIQVSDDAYDSRNLFSVVCKGVDQVTVAPKVTIAGQVSAVGEAPYLVNATYNIDVRSKVDQAVGEAPYNQQTLSGKMLTSTSSVSVLPVQFSKQTAWDPQNNILSVEERPGKWRAFSVNYLAIGNEAVIVDSGVVSEPVVDGKSRALIAFDQTVSRFAAKNNAPVLEAFVGVREGLLQVLIDTTKHRNKESIQDAVAHLDAKGSDMERAWALASKAKFIGASNEVRYAQQKVAASNPHLLEEFQRDLRKIHQFELPRQ